MISLRSHAISLAAVFLALAIGVALGSGLLSNTVLSGLRDDKHELQNQINTLTDDKNALNEKLNAAGEFDAQMSPRILHDTLAGKSVVVFRTPDANDDDAAERAKKARVLVVEAEGRLVGVIVDEVSEVLRLAAAQVDPPPPMVAGLSNQYLKGVGRLKDDLLILIDIEKVLTSDDLGFVNIMSILPDAFKVFSLRPREYIEARPEARIGASG